MMLCRVADSLFWMSRYIERAENTARLMDVNLQLLLDSEEFIGHQTEEFWRPILQAIGDDNLYRQSHETYESAEVMHFLTFDTDNPSSIVSCVAAARENARMIRDQISEEMWEIVNRLYHYLKSCRPGTIGQAELYQQFSKIKEYAHLFTGTTVSTYNHGVGYDFIRAGWFVERADKTGRMISSKLSLLGNDNAPAAISSWAAVLRACSASTAYKQTYKMLVQAPKVLDLLVFSREFPRSMFYCVMQLQRAIHSISGCPTSHYSNEVERLCGRLLSDLNYSSVDEMLRGKPEDFLANIYTSLEQITLQLSQSYMFFPIVDPAAEA